MQGLSILICSLPLSPSAFRAWADWFRFGPEVLMLGPRIQFGFGENEPSFQMSESKELVEE